MVDGDWSERLTVGFANSPGESVYLWHSLSFLSTMSNQLWNVGQLFFILGDFLMFGPCLKVRFDVEALYLQFISFSSLIDPLKTKPYLDIFGDWPIDPIGSPRYNWRSSSAYLEATRFANRVLWRRMTLWHVCTSTLKIFPVVRWGAWSFGPVLDGKLGSLLIAQDAWSWNMAID